MSHIRIEMGGPIARVVLDHAGGNRINFAMREDLLRAFESIVSSDARVLVVQGEGKDFCLGGDVRDWPGISAAELRPKVEVFAKALAVLEQLKIPTIAAVQGGCMGGGFELALTCDMIIATKSAKFSFPEAKLGIMTLQGGVMQLAERIGRAKAIELVFLSDPVSAEQMATWNVVNRVVADAELSTEVDALATRLAAGPPLAYAGTKALMRAWSIEGLASARNALYDISMPMFDSQDVRGALRAAAEAVEAGRPFPPSTFAGR